jgi:hypothetical protein
LFDGFWNVGTKGNERNKINTRIMQRQYEKTEDRKKEKKFRGRRIQMERWLG